MLRLTFSMFDGETFLCVATTEKKSHKNHFCVNTQEEKGKRIMNCVVFFFFKENWLVNNVNALFCFWLEHEFCQFCDGLDDNFRKTLAYLSIWRSTELWNLWHCFFTSVRSPFANHSLDHSIKYFYCQSTEKTAFLCANSLALIPFYSLAFLFHSLRSLTFFFFFFFHKKHTSSLKNIKFTLRY